MTEELNIVNLFCGMGGDELGIKDMRNYELTDVAITVDGHVLHRIRAVKDIPHINISIGDLGGWIESTDNLRDDAWVFDDAMVFGKAVVRDRACVFDYARVRDDAVVSDIAHVRGNARVFGNASVFDDAYVMGRAVIHDSACVGSHAKICGNAEICGCAQILGYACVFDDARVYDRAYVFGNARIYGAAKVHGHARVHDEASIFDDAEVYGDEWVSGIAELCGDAVVVRESDYAVYKNTWSSRRWFTYTRSNKKWKVGCFHGTGDRLIAKAYRDSQLSGHCYETIVRAQEAIEKAIEKERAK